MGTILAAAAASLVTTYSVSRRYQDTFRRVLIAILVGLGCAAFLGVYFFAYMPPDREATGMQWLIFGAIASVCGPLAGALLAKFGRNPKS